MLNVWLVVLVFTVVWVIGCVCGSGNRHCVGELSECWMIEWSECWMIEWSGFWMGEWGEWSECWMGEWIVNVGWVNGVDG